MARSTPIRSRRIRVAHGDFARGGGCPVLLPAALVEGVHEPRVARDVHSAQDSGVLGTPAFFTNGVHHAGSFDAGSLIDALRAAEPARRS